MIAWRNVTEILVCTSTKQKLHKLHYFIHNFIGKSFLLCKENVMLKVFYYAKIMSCRKHKCNNVYKTPIHIRTSCCQQRTRAGPIRPLVGRFTAWDQRERYKWFKTWLTTMMTSSNGNIFSVTGPLWGEPPVTGGFPSHRPATLELWCFLWSAPEQTVEPTMDTLVICDAIALIMTSL